MIHIYKNASQFLDNIVKFRPYCTFHRFSHHQTNANIELSRHGINGVPWCFSTSIHWERETKKYTIQYIAWDYIPQIVDLQFWLMHTSRVLTTIRLDFKDIMKEIEIPRWLYENQQHRTVYLAYLESIFISLIILKSPFPLIKYISS